MRTNALRWGLCPRTRPPAGEKHGESIAENEYLCKLDWHNPARQNQDKHNPITMKILVTGAAGFIGSKLMYTLRERGDEVIGIDNFNDYYDVRLKEARVKALGLDVIKMDLADKEAIDQLFETQHFDKVVNMAAQVGVRYSITNPYAYLQSNLVGFLNILEACRHYNVKHLIYASSSSVYGMNAKVPYSEDDKVDNPVSLYAATKKSNELMAHSYCKL